MNIQRTSLIEEARKQETPFWQRVADDLEKASRRRVEVNLSRIARASKQGETVVVPGKVLGNGQLAHKVRVVAFSFSQSALRKLEEADCESMSISEFLQKDPQGNGRIIG